MQNPKAETLPHFFRILGESLDHVNSTLRSVQNLVEASNSKLYPENKTWSLDNSHRETNDRLLE